MQGAGGGGGGGGGGGSLLDVLLQRENGMLEPWRFQNTLQDERLRSLELSLGLQVLSGHVAAVTSLDVDAVETRYLLSAGLDGKLVLYDLEDPENEAHNTGDPRTVPPVTNDTDWNAEDVHQYAVSCALWYPHDTGMVVSASADETVRVWDTNELSAACVFDMEAPVRDIAMSAFPSNRTLIATATAGSHVKLCDMHSGASSHSLIGHRGEVTCVEWSPTHEHTLVSGGVDGTVRLWDVRRSGALMIMDQYNQRPGGLGKRSASVADERRGMSAQSHAKGVAYVKFSPDGLYLLSLGAEPELRLWTAADGQNTFVNFAVKPSVRSFGNRFAITSNSKYVMLGTGSEVAMLELSTGAVVRVERGHMDTVLCCAAHPTKEQVFSSGRDLSILTWVPSQDNALFQDEQQLVLHEQFDVQLDGDDWSDDE